MMLRVPALWLLASCTSVMHVGPGSPMVNEMPFAANIDRTDRVSPGAAPVADGTPDAEFLLTVQGPVAAIILAVCSEGAATSSQWDTVAGATRLPAGFAWRTGAETWVLGVSDAEGNLVNAEDGSLPAMDLAAPTTFTLSAADNGVLEAGVTVCAWVMRPDGTSLRASAQVP